MSRFRETSLFSSEALFFSQGIFGAFESKGYSEDARAILSGAPINKRWFRERIANNQNWGLDGQADPEPH
jgi:hypothetical protein